MDLAKGLEHGHSDKRNAIFSLRLCPNVPRMLSGNIDSIGNDDRIPHRGFREG